MSLRRIIAASTFALFVVTAAPTTILASSGHTDVKYKHYANCTKMHKDYPHGVGKVGAKDHVSGRSKPVKNFYVSTGLYNANKGSDGDGDGVACEAH